MTDRNDRDDPVDDFGLEFLGLVAVLASAIVVVALVGAWLL